ncbi:MAG: hypothetical protein RSE51_04655, partial [Bacteroidales bacterium]
TAAKYFVIADAKVMLIFKPPNFSRKVFLFIFQSVSIEDKKRSRIVFIVRFGSGISHHSFCTHSISLVCVTKVCRFYFSRKHNGSIFPFINFKTSCAPFYAYLTT